MATTWMYEQGQASAESELFAAAAPKNNEPAKAEEGSRISS